MSTDITHTTLSTAGNKRHYWINHSPFHSKYPPEVLQSGATFLSTLFWIILPAVILIIYTTEFISIYFAVVLLLNNNNNNNNNIMTASVV